MLVHIHIHNINSCTVSEFLLESCIADSRMDMPVLELQRVGCESVELSIDEITTDSVARAFKVLKTVKVIVSMRSLMIAGT